MKDMKVNVICDGRKGSEKNPASIAIILHLPNNIGGYSRFYADILYSNESKVWYFSRMNHNVDEDVILKVLFESENMFSLKVCNRINKIWKNKKW